MQVLTGRQAEMLLELEADAWLDRNRDKLGKVDKVSDVIEGLGLIPKTVVEVGCSNGWRLNRLQNKYGCRAIGVEPGKIAAFEGRKKGLHIKRSTAEKLPIMSGWADTLIYGFCLYLTDPEDWLKIAAEGDRVLAPGGHLIVHDFADDGFFAKTYRHRRGMLSYHYDFSKLWLGHPLYRRASSHVFYHQKIEVLEKRPTSTIEVTA